MYGSSTMLVYTTGQGRARLHARSRPSASSCSRTRDIMHPAGRASTTASTRATSPAGTAACRRRSAGFHGDRPDEIKGKNSRYIGSLVADFHRNLISGGIFMYPADARNPNGKLRLLYEAAPLAFIAEQAGGSATDGANRILDIQPVTPPAHAARHRLPARCRIRSRYPPPHGDPGQRRAHRLGAATTLFRSGGLDRRSRARSRPAGPVPLYPRRLPRHVHRPALDHAAVCRVRDRGRDQRALPQSPCQRPDRPLDRLRSSHADGIRLRPSDGSRARSAASASPSIR